VEIPVPRFPTAAAAPTTAPQPAPDAGRLPADCEQLVGHDELPGLFGLPVDSVTVRTVRGMPSPSVGRVERVDCTYTVTAPAAPGLQGVVLRMTVGRYHDVAAARAQHDRNVADQRAGTSVTTQPDLGATAASMVQRGAESILLTSYGTVTVDFDLMRPPGPLPPRDLLTDLVRRVLARPTTQPPDGVSDRTSP
jgi:hypothetical protein